MILRRRSALLGTALLLVAPRAARAQGQLQPTIRVIGPPNDGFKPVFYGVRSGIFRKYNLNVEPTLINSGNAAAAALIGGAAEVAYTNITTAITAHAKGLPLQIIAPGLLLTTETNGTSAILVLKDGPIRSGRDLNGKNIGLLALGDSMQASVQAWIDQNGGDSRTVKMIEVPPSSVVQMLEEGRVSAAGINEPAVSQAIAGGKVRVIANPLTAIAKAFLAALFGVMGPAADKYPEAMRRFARAMRESSAYTNKHMAETVELVASYSGATPEAVARSVRMTDADYAEPVLIQPVIDVLVKYAVVDRAFPAADLVSPYALRAPNRRAPRS